ncbi:MAG TPA: hypothetical protein VFD43_08760, partial [Planctomycetota bacterium]|nr:hypothetical protein [Planctomycetota bacterium]
MTELASGAPPRAPAPAPAGVAGAAIVLRAAGLQRRYRMGQEVIEVLRGLDLQLASGESVAIMGRSGAGK